MELGRRSLLGVTFAPELGLGRAGQGPGGLGHVSLLSPTASEGSSVGPRSFQLWQCPLPPAHRLRLPSGLLGSVMPEFGMLGAQASWEGMTSPGSGGRGGNSDASASIFPTRSPGQCPSPSQPQGLPVPDGAGEQLSNMLTTSPVTPVPQMPVPWALLWHFILWKLEAWGMVWLN